MLLFDPCYFNLNRACICVQMAVLFSEWWGNFRDSRRYFKNIITRFYTASLEAVACILKTQRQLYGKTRLFVRNIFYFTTRLGSGSESVDVCEHT